MHCLEFSSVTPSIKPPPTVAAPHHCVGGSLPPGLGRLWAMNQRRQTFWARSQSPPFQNWSSDQRRADFLARQQLEMRQFLPDPYLHMVCLIANESSGPLAGPTDGDHDSLVAGQLQIEVGEIAAGRTAADGSYPLLRCRAENRFERLVIAGDRAAASVVMKQELSLIGAGSGFRSI